MDKDKKHDAYMNHFLQKPCKICNTDNYQNLDILLCDKCDDGYHCICLDPPITLQMLQKIQIWVCPQCQQILNEQNNNQNNIQQFNKIYDCYKCSQKVQNCQQKIQIFLLISQGNYEKKSVNSNNGSMKTCRHCKQNYHTQCFNFRSNCVNCQKCQKNIRKQCPKNHTDFMLYLKQDLNKIRQYGLKQLDFLSQHRNFPSNQKLDKIGLKIFDYLNDWQLICRSQSSLFYALRTNDLYYCRSQLYKNSEIMILNQSRLNIVPPSSLNQFDQNVYENFRKLVARNLIPPLEIKQDYLKGFYVVSVQFIPALTLICQYTGQVCTRSESNKKHTHNDSVMSLIVTEFSSSSLDIAPQKFSNMSRFISGVPPDRKDLQNVKTLNFCYQGRSHIIFYTIKNIQKGEVLYIDYNDGIFEEYPNEHFVV